MPPPGMDIFPTAIRLRVLEHGYAPVPIVAHDADHKSCGKAVNLSQWTTIEITPEAVRSWRTGRQSGDIGTGLRCGELVGVGHRLPHPGGGGSAVRLRARRLGSNAASTHRTCPEDVARLPSRPAAGQVADAEVSHAGRGRGASRGSWTGAAIRRVRHSSCHPPAISPAGHVAARRSRARSAERRACPPRRVRGRCRSNPTRGRRSHEAGDHRRRSPAV